MTYRFATWDHEQERWDTVQRRGGIFALRAIIRDFREYCADCALLVQRSGDRVGARRRGVECAARIKRMEDTRLMAACGVEQQGELFGS